MTSSACYPGSFDPITNGHLDILRQAMTIFGRVVVAIGVHPGKKPLLSFDERADLIRGAASDLALRLGSSLEVIAFDGLVVEAARLAEAPVLVRGLRDGSDLDYEMQLAGMNGVLSPEIQTVFFPAAPAVRPITATLVRQIAAMGGDISPFVPPNVRDALRSRFA